MRKVQPLFQVLTLFLIVLLLGEFGSSDTVLAHGNSGGANSENDAARTIPLLPGLLVHNFPVTTKNAEAQAYFNQGLVLAYGFDHADAEVSFLEAAKEDPDCAMAYWGVAFVLGPNINAPMDPAMAPRAYEMARKALALSSQISPKESALITALFQRYAPVPVADRAALDQAFARAMQGAYDRFPNDPDIAVLYAEALMDLHPWDYWMADGSPQPWTPQIRKVLEKVIGTFPENPHGHHLYIHLMENSPTPEVTIKSADLISTLAPASGHLVHMAAHAYYAVGFYHASSQADERAIAVDNLLASSFATRGLYQTGYVPHVKHYLLASYMMEGRSKEAIRVAHDLAAGINLDEMRGPGGGTLQHFYLSLYYVLARFGQWHEILTLPAPPSDLLYPLGMYHYARGLARLRTGSTAEAQEELTALEKITRDKGLAEVKIWDINKASDLLAIATEVLTGELAAAIDQGDQAVDHLTRAVSLEDQLPFDEPPPWYFPVRQALGAVFLDQGKNEEAEGVFRRDLEKNTENPWSLFGLAESLRLQGKTEQIADTEKRFQRSWSRADLTLKCPVF